MAPDQEPGPGSAPPERTGTAPHRRRGRRSGRGRRGRGPRPSPAATEELPPSAEQQAEPLPPLAETASAEGVLATPPFAEPLPIPPTPMRPAVEEPHHLPAIREPRTTSPASPAAVQQAIEEVNHIIETLRGTLDDMEEVLETLELAERQKNADEQEIETLHRGLRQLHRPREGGHHPPRH
jgi:hypothetical protein